MKFLVFIFISLFLALNKCDDEYSINTLLNFLQSTGYYEIIYEIKLSFGDDVAIAFCKEIVPTNHCDEVVKVYMPPPSVGKKCPRNINDIKNIISRPKIHENLISNINILNRVFKRLCNITFELELGS